LSATAATTFRLKRILVTTDFSAESKRALPYAAAIAKRLGSEVALLNVVEPPPRLSGLESVVLLQTGDAAVGRVYGGLDALARRTFKTGTRVKTHVHTGKPFREIVNAARELDANLVIMATHGYGGLKHTFLGSTTERVIRHAPCPVLAVRGNKDTRQKSVAMQRIVVTTDFSDNALRALPLAQSLAAKFGADITLMHVVDRFPIDAMLGEELTRDNRTRLTEQAQTRLNEVSRSWRERSGLKVDAIVRFGKPFDEITRNARALDASLIVLATHGYTGLKHAYLGSVAERVVRHAHCPVLVVRELSR
jgi:nucleotide-binding universal stress UspA family protein